MSTIVAVKKAGEFAIAADSLTTWGGAKESADYIVNHEKIITVGDSYLAITGPTSAKLAISEYFSSNKDVDLTNVKSIYRVWLKLHAALVNQYFMNSTESRNDAFESTRVDVLIANRSGIFGVEAHRVVQEFSKFYAYGTGWQVALGAMYSVYAHQARSAEDIARIGIEASAEFDSDTGMPVVSYSGQLAE
ncbi:hypothetical protein IMX07_10345 [bacterium]|nr:hypothetical protein [bacterium]